jgi:hypothetical protein
MYHFFEGIQGNFFSSGLPIGAQIWGQLYQGVHIQTTSLLCALWSIGCLRTTFSKDFRHHVDPYSSLCHSHHCTTTAITHHGIVPNNLDLVPTSVNIFLQQLIVTIANIPPTVDAPTFVNLVGEVFRVLELEFLVKNSEKILQFTTKTKRMKPLRCSIGTFSRLKRTLRA